MSRLTNDSMNDVSLDCALQFWLVERVPQKLVLCFVKLIVRLCGQLHFLSFGFLRFQTHYIPNLSPFT